MKNIAASALVLATLAGGLSIASPVVYGQAAIPDAQQAQTQTQARPDRAHRLPGARIEARLAYLKTALKITPAQEPQWNAFADVLRQQARARDTEIQQRRSVRQSQNAQPQPSTAIERLQRRQQMMATAAVRMNDIVVAAQPLYATFNDEQKKAADELLDRRGGHGRHGRWH